MLRALKRKRVIGDKEVAKQLTLILKKSNKGNVVAERGTAR